MNIKNYTHRPEDQRIRSKDFVAERAQRIDNWNQKAAIQSAMNEDGYTERNLRVGDLVLRLFNG